MYGLLSGGTQVAATPLISPASESVTTSVQVTISDSTAGSSIFYTTDGSTPVPGSGSTVKYSGAVTLTSSHTVKGCRFSERLHEQCRRFPNLHDSV